MTSYSLPRQTRLKRSKRRYPLDQIECGQAALVALASLRFATNGQLQRVCFNPLPLSAHQARHVATRTLRRLFDAGYVRRVEVFAPSLVSGRLSRQMVSLLTPHGARAIGLDVDWLRFKAPQRDQVLTHAFWLVELGVLALSQCPPPLRINTWWDDRVLAARRRQGQLSLPIIPDAFVIVQHRTTGKYYPAFVELDLGSESVERQARRQGDIRHKIESYLAYPRSAMTTDFGLDAPLIMLIVTSTPRRLATIRDLTQRLGGGGRFWFATLDDLRQSRSAESPTAHSAALEGSFWESKWKTAASDELRSLASRCGV